MPFMAIFQLYLIGVFRVVKAMRHAVWGVPQSAGLGGCRHPIAPLGQFCANCSELACTAVLD